MYRWVTILLCAAAPLTGDAGSQACASCHRSLFESYMRSPMANSAGVAGSGLIQEKFDRAGFLHQTTGFRYQVAHNSAGYLLSYENGETRASKPLPYFIGSGAVARSYILAASGFLFEAPVAYYSASGKWDMAPGYGGYAYPYLTRPIQPGCLSCHASFLQPVAGTQNRYGDPPFKEGGVACERCHGPGEAHIQQMNAGRKDRDLSIVNPAKLDPGRRDSICSQCHLSGEVRVTRAGRTWDSFRPGELLSDSVAVFVREGASPGMTVSSHVEKLAQSRCKIQSGDRLWCGSCHQPHAPANTARIRAACLNCHQPKDCSESMASRRRRSDDCLVCHMPKSPVTDAQHVVYKDHSIPRAIPRQIVTTNQRVSELVPFGSAATERDLALAYAILASRGQDSQLQTRAQGMLEKAAATDPADVEVLLYLAERYRGASKYDAAIPLYERAMRLDPSQVTASIGLGAIRMERGQYQEAIRLWEDGLTKNAGLQLVRVNLAMAYWRAGEAGLAQAVLRKALELNPGFPPAEELLRRITRAQ